MLSYYGGGKQAGRKDGPSCWFVWAQVGQHGPPVRRPMCPGLLQLIPKEGWVTDSLLLLPPYCSAPPPHSSHPNQLWNTASGIAVSDEISSTRTQH
jgi:hypothetical protein